MLQLKTEIIINAPATKIWKLLSNFKEYENWNPFIVLSSGKAIVGEKIKNSMKIQGRIQTFKPVLLQVVENQKLEWIGSLFFKGLFDGQHYFEIEKIDESNCKLIQGEKFSGILAKPILNKIKNDTLEGFIAMNEALKREAEK